MIPLDGLTTVGLANGPAGQLKKDLLSRGGQKTCAHYTDALLHCP